MYRNSKQAFRNSYSGGTKIPHAARQLSLAPATREAHRHKKILCVATKTQHSQINIKFLQNFDRVILGLWNLTIKI